jgi:hypothetical protein
MPSPIADNDHQQASTCSSHATGSVDRPPTGFAWSPLRQQLFRSLWIASLASNLGTWMQSVGAAWLMTDLAASPMTVALVQAATNLPVTPRLFAAMMTSPTTPWGDDVG